MAITSTQSFPFKLIANGTQLDLFQDETILLSDNVTGLFDIGTLPAEFTRQILVPGTKKNNAFFEHVYDISVDFPELFSTNRKVEAYLDFDGIYLAQGYIQLNKVNVLANKFIDSYEVSIYGTISSFARDINRTFLTDMTSSLASYNHVASYNNISASWGGNLFGGDIVYPFAEYGQKIMYSPETEVNGIDSPQGGLFVQDFKPAIRVKAVWDAIFNQYGYTYSGSFWNQSWLNDVYMVCNNKLRYPIFDEENLETYGLLKMQPISGSTEIPLTNNAALALPYYNITSNPAGNMNTSSLVYGLDYPSKLRGVINLNLKLVNPGPPIGSNFGYPKFSLVVTNAGGTPVDTVPLQAINDYFENLSSAWISQGTFTPTQKFTVPSEFNTGYLPSGSYKFAVKYEYQVDNNFYVVLDPDGELKSYLEITKAGNVGEGWTMNIGKNMPYGTNGIKQIDFIKGLQKKFNLVIYPSKTKLNEFIVETFNRWYNTGEIKNFDKYINLNEKLEVIPANNLAVNELNFGDTLDQDYVSQQFQKEANRDYGKQYYVDTQNYFSQGKFEVQTTFASSPLIYLQGTGISGSAAVFTTNRVKAVDTNLGNVTITCLGGSYTNIEHKTIVYYTDADGNVITNTGSPVTVQVRYEITDCNGVTSLSAVPFTIATGASGSQLTYYQKNYVDCGGGAPCLPEYQDIQCIASASGQYGMAVWGGSTIPAC